MDRRKRIREREDADPDGPDPRQREEAHDDEAPEDGSDEIGGGKDEDAQEDDGAVEPESAFPYPEGADRVVCNAITRGQRCGNHEGYRELRGPKEQ